jgi:CxxC-x17-CxxC domain-containing protein
MNNFKKPGFGGNGGNRGGFGGGRPSFGGKRDFGGRPSNDMHQAICEACGKSCEVPFRPNGKKPVYCTDCYGKQGGQGSDRGSSFAPKRDFTPDRTPYVPSAPSSAPAQNNDRLIDGLKKQLEAMNSKIDRLVSIMESNARPAVKEVSAAKPVPQTIPTSLKTKKVAVKAAPKKPVAKKAAPKAAAKAPAKKVSKKK